MISLDKHISHLIALHDCVIVPGFGAFLSQHIPAHYNAADRVFMPPCRTLCFNQQITMDDALLTTEYMRQYGISFNQAAMLMKDDIRKLRNRLSRKGERYFGELGKLTMNIEGNITFKPSENGIDDPANYGLMPLPIPMLSHKEEPAIVIPISRRRIAQYVAAAAAIIIMFVFVTPLSEHTFKNNTKASFGDFASPEQISMLQQVGAQTATVSKNSTCEICPIEEATAIKEKPSVQETAETTTPIVVEAPAATAPAVAQKQFHIIVASSPSNDNAQLAIKELSAKATHDYKIVESGKRFRISAAAFASQEEAQTALPAIQEQFADAWIYMH